MSRTKNIVGQKFDRLLVISRGPNDAYGQAQWNCLCDCGGAVTVRNSWSHMRRRCLNKDFKDYAQWGGRGITIDPRWESFAQFLSDMGPSPGRGYSLERLNNDGNYAPGNVIWATQKVQTNNTRRNRRMLFNGGLKLISEIAAKHGLTYRALEKRLRKMTLETALSIPPRQ